MLLLLLLLLLCAIPGKEDWTWQGSESRRIRDQEKAVPFCHSWLLPALLGSSAPTLQGRLGYKEPRAKSFIGEKKTKEKVVAFCRTQGCLLIRNFFSSVLQNKVERAGMQTISARWGKNYFKRFLYNMYRSRCKPAPQLQNTQYLKTNRNRDRPLASPNRSVGGHNQAEIQSSS